ncbi:MAG TPA: Maf family protein [Sphingomicrobium sp.]|nr:Maf family protein [Sphingomicrobium sp.]
MALILASSSAIRAHMLDAASVDHQVYPADIDEDVVKAAHNGDAASLATELASTKATAVSALRPGDWVIGSDSLINVAGRRFDKPENREEAADHLRTFSGQAIILTSAVSLARDGEVVWSHAERATLHVRALSDTFIESYLDAEWPEVGYCAGVFRMEARGVQLFERVDGDHFTILGMPLLPLLGALRDRGLIAT